MGSFVLLRSSSGASIFLLCLGLRNASAPCAQCRFGTGQARGLSQLCLSRCCAGLMPGQCAGAISLCRKMGCLLSSRIAGTERFSFLAPGTLQLRPAVRDSLSAGAFLPAAWQDAAKCASKCSFLLTFVLTPCKVNATFGGRHRDRFSSWKPIPYHVERRPLPYVGVDTVSRPESVSPVTAGAWWTWLWLSVRLFVLDFPAALVRNVAIVAGTWSEPVLSSDDAFLLQVPAVQSPALVSKHVAPTVSLQTSYGLLATFVMAVWLSIGIPRSVNLVHTDWPFVGPDMFSHIGRWSSPSPFQDILQDQMNGQRRKA